MCRPVHNHATFLLFCLFFGHLPPPPPPTIVDVIYVVCSLARRALHLGGVGVEAVHFQLERPDLAAEPVTFGLLVRILLALKLQF